ncbi:MAG: hypothetical protein J07HQW1_03200 [Haloquadratum walsbyi J07HQW1]|uniref:Uncharacterized protein n=1 Tax=Haloquadratum walsbyi J07HQW1 TaxID=1238424 RepID=U1PHL4_9EURY|nr:MAG: hypothetical protein J07HQW1_03200 [Haloquadratum walsbyi J07HQW1]
MQRQKKSSKNSRSIDEDEGETTDETDSDPDDGPPTDNTENNTTGSDRSTALGSRDNFWGG